MVYARPLQVRMDQMKASWPKFGDAKDDDRGGQASLAKDPLHRDGHGHPLKTVTSLHKESRLLTFHVS